jgi:hypothetical protein
MKTTVTSKLLQLLLDIYILSLFSTQHINFFPTFLLLPRPVKFFSVVYKGYHIITWLRITSDFYNILTSSPEALGSFTIPFYDVVT